MIPINLQGYSHSSRCEAYEVRPGIVAYREKPLIMDSIMNVIDSINIFKYFKKTTETDKCTTCKKMFCENNTRSKCSSRCEAINLFCTDCNYICTNCRNDDRKKFKESIHGTYNNTNNCEKCGIYHLGEICKK
jgi:hypothetical protein